MENTPNTVSALASTYPTASSQLILVEGDIPGQEGLRILPAAPVLGLESRGFGLRGWQGGSEKERPGDDSVYVCTRLQLHDSARLFQGCGVVEPAVLSIDCYFESPADGTAVSQRRGPLEISAILRLRRRGGVKGHRGILSMLLPLYVISFRGSDSKVAITLTELWQGDSLTAS